MADEKIVLAKVLRIEFPRLRQSDVKILPTEVAELVSVIAAREKIPTVEALKRLEDAISRLPGNPTMAEFRSSLPGGVYTPRPRPGRTIGEG